MSEYKYDPDYAVHPGGVIREMLDEAGMRQAHLAGACHVSPKHMNQVVQGVKPLHAKLAVDIEYAFGRLVAQVLMRMQADYDVMAARETARQEWITRGERIDKIAATVTGEATSRDDRCDCHACVELAVDEIIASRIHRGRW